MNINNIFNFYKFHNLTAKELNLIFSILSKIHDLDNSSIINRFDLLETANIKTNESVYRISQIIPLIEKLLNTKVYLCDEHKREIINIFSKISFDKSEQEFTIKLNPDFKPLLETHKKQYFKISIENFVNLKSKFAKLLYLRLSQFRYTGLLEAKIKELMQFLDVKESYEKISIFKQKVLEPAIVALSDIFIDLNYTIEDKKVIFTFKKEIKENKIKIPTKKEPIKSPSTIEPEIKTTNNKKPSNDLEKLKYLVGKSFKLNDKIVVIKSYRTDLQAYKHFLITEEDTEISISVYDFNEKYEILLKNEIKDKSEQEFKKSEVIDSDFTFEKDENGKYEFEHFVGANIDLNGAKGFIHSCIFENGILKVRIDFETKKPTIFTIKNNETYAKFVNLIV